MSAYQPNGVIFSGTAYLTRGAQYTSAVDSKLATLAFAVKFTGAATDQNILQCPASSGTYPSLVIGRDTTTNAIYVFGGNASTINLDYKSGSLSTGQWYAVLISFDQTDSAKHHLYINDASNIASTATYNNVARDFTNANNSIGAQPAGSSALVGELADVWFDINRYVDFSVEANRRLFFNSDNSLVDKGLDGSVPFSAAPTLFLSGPLSLWHTNKGGGGGMTKTGTVTRSSALPAASSDVRTLAPTSIEASTNLTGAVTVVDDAVDDADASWLTATSATAATDIRFGFGTPV